MLKLSEAVSRLEARMVRSALSKTQGNASQAAALLGLGRNQFYRIVERNGIKLWSGEYRR